MQSPTRTRASWALALVVLLLLGAAVPVPASDGSARKEGSSKASPDDPIDINTASVESLTTVPGIGQVTAERIVQWRKTHGPFRRVDDLLKVKGIGERTLDKLRPYLKVGKTR